MKSKKIIDKLLAQRESYAFYAVRPSTIQRDEAVRLIFNKNLNSSYVVLPLANKNTSYYGERKKMHDFDIKYSKKLLNPVFSRQHFIQYKKDSKDLIDIAYLAMDLQPVARDLIKIFERWNNILAKYSFYFYMPFAIEACIEPQLRGFLLKKYPQNFEEIFNIIGSPTQVFDYQHYQKELLSMADSIDFAYLINKYAWVKEYSFKEELLNKDLIKGDLVKIKSENLEGGILHVEETINKNKSAYDHFIKYLDKNSELFRMVDVAHHYVDIRTERIEVYKKSQTYFRNFYKVLSTWLKVNGHQLEYLDVLALTNREIFDLLEGRRTFDEKVLKYRKNGEYLIWAQGVTDKPDFVYDKKLINLVRKSFSYVSHSSQIEIKGLSASNGQAQGLVRIIAGQKDFSSFKKDEILVTYFTTPDFVALMKMAKAIVTDDGGITCHAGIVARELRKPCIVGTKYATQVFKDGDLVEVDANNGIVKKLIK